MGSDGCSVLAGFTVGNWNGTEDIVDGQDFAAVKLAFDGSVLWRWQVRRACSHVLSLSVRLNWRSFSCIVVFFIFREFSRLALRVQ